MTDIREHRVLVCFVAAFVLLSFFFAGAGSGRAGLSGKREGSDCGKHSHTAEEKCEVETRGCIKAECSRTFGAAGLRTPRLVGAPDKGIPTGSAGISLAGMVLDEIVTKEQLTTRTLLLRFFIVIYLFILSVTAACRIAIRRFSGHMIPVWENIYYIHQVDGKKEKALLYT